MNGLVIKIISEFAYVQAKNNKIYECKTKGIFRYKNIKPIVGDYVDFDLDDNNKGLITKIYHRKNSLKRPMIVNVDQVIIISALKEPSFNANLLNRYMFIIEFLNMVPVLVFTKKDLINETQIKDKIILEEINWYKKMGYDTFFINNKNQKDLEFNNFKKILSNKISVFTGQTGAGKSTTINNLIGEDKQATNSISKALGRGKHTTRVTELFCVNDYKIIDTPGFSAFDLDEINPNLLSQRILPFKNDWNKCKFKNCIHISEPNCKIKELIALKKIPNFFYEDYKRVILLLTNNTKGMSR